MATPYTPDTLEAALKAEGIGTGTTAGPQSDPRIYPVDPDSFILLSAFIEEKMVLKRATTSSTTYYAVAFWKTWTTNISNPSTGGSEMGYLDQIRAFFDAHPRTRDFIKNGIVWAIGYAAATYSGGNGMVGAGVAAVLGWLAAHVNATTTWPIIGAKKPAKKSV